MAENILETRILLRYGTYSQWMNSDVILKLGEAAIAAFPRERVIEAISNATPENTPPAIGIKIGDGVHYFHELPWVQAIAADVFTWAKQSTKPTYTAQEIQGLQSFVEGLVSGDVDITIAPRIYQLVQGTNENQYKYYLQYKENNEESDWVLDTSSYIDLTDLNKLTTWIGMMNVEDYPSMLNLTAEQIRYFLSTLTVQDTSTENYFVTAVNQTNGMITVEKARPTFSNLSGFATVEQGGTGRTSLTEDAVLVGNGTDAVKLVPIAESIANNDYLVTNKLVKQYIDNSVAGLSGAMHFIGEASVVIVPNSGVDPRISGYDFSQAQPGDVVLSDAKEYVWTGSQWRLLGDESSYAIKGSIRNSDIDPDANIDQSKIAGLADTFDTKVDKQDGKALTSNDFTDDLLNKLNEIEEGAERNTIEHVFKNGVEIRPAVVENLERSVNIEIQEFDTASQEKLAGISSGAQANTIEHIIYDGVEVTPDASKTITITPDPHTEHENKIESIIINGSEYHPNTDKQVNITIDQAALNLNVLEGAVVPSGLNTTEEVPQVQKKLQLARIAATGDVQDLKQTINTYIILDCGNSTEVI